MMALRDVVDVLFQIMTTFADVRGTCLLASGHTMRLINIAEIVQRHAREVLGISAAISAPETGSIHPPTFVLRPSKLLSAGISIPQHLDEEIRDLLRYAQREFGVTPS
jgi:hypothetical protein